MTRLIQISDSIKGEIAERLVEQSHPGYSTEYMGQWYVVDGSSVQHKQRNAPWAPWSDDADVIAVDDLVFMYGGAEGCDFDPSSDDESVSEEDAAEAAVSFALGYIPSEYDADDYEARNDY